jgi:hypothetical protein
MALVRAAAMQRGDDLGEDVMRRRDMVVVLRVARACGWFFIVAGPFLLATL